MDDLELIRAVQALPPALSDDTLAALAQELHRPVDRGACDREIGEVVRLACVGSLSGFDRLPDPLKRIAHVRFRAALERGLLAPGVEMFDGPTGVPITPLGGKAV